MHCKLMLLHLNDMIETQAKLPMVVYYIIFVCVCVCLGVKVELGRGETGGGEFTHFEPFSED